MAFGGAVNADKVWLSTSAGIGHVLGSVTIGTLAGGPSVDGELAMLESDTLVVKVHGRQSPPKRPDCQRTEFDGREACQGDFARRLPCHDELSNHVAKGAFVGPPMPIGSERERLKPRGRCIDGDQWQNVDKHRRGLLQRE